MDLKDLEKRYNALLPVPSVPFSREWVDRVTTFEHFMEMGQKVSNDLARLDDDDRERVRGYAPELFDLLVEVFPPNPGRK